MVYAWLVPLSRHVASFRAFESVTFRAACAALTALLVCVIVGPGIIERLAALRWRERTDTDHAGLNAINDKERKAGTPTMGGMIFVLATACAVLLFGRLDNRLVVLCLWTTVAFGVLGGMDDRIKLQGRVGPDGKPVRGLTERQKLIGQWALALAVVTWAWLEMREVPGWSDVRVPFLGPVPLWAPLALFFGAFVIVATDNAVNLTDGLDGLAAGCGAIVTMVLAVAAYCAGRRTLAADLGHLFVPGADEVAVFLAALGGGLAGFLWWNCKPAKVFMGNTGALALGGAFGVTAFVVRQEFLLLVAGFAFAWEVLSVVIQRWSFRHRGGRRVFRCAPFHHHLQLLGWPEPKVVMSFWIGTAFLGVVALGLQRVL
jgi:phospho-N-acetylmuramoyl-pentapeptide-transferase